MGGRRSTFNGVVEGQDVHPLPVGDVRAGGESDEVTQADAEVLADHLLRERGWVGRWVGGGE